ncbi:MAG TPA: T9SS type A sorting domain-containing protein [Chitinophagales bacterium]|nr:T9SS type A sorting domain-containing protein [Chitinophagales bacterium]
MKKTFLLQLVLVLSVMVSQAQGFQFQTIGTTGISSGTPTSGTILNGKIYVSGKYYYVDGVQVNNFAVIDGNTYSESGDIPGTKTCDFGYSVATNTIYALTSDSPNYVYSQNQMGEWDPVPISFDNQPMFIYTLNDSEFVITGGFTVVNGISANYICTWNAVTNTVTDIGGLPGPDIYTKMCLYLGKLLVPYYIASTSDPHFMVLDLNTMELDYDPQLELSNVLLYGLWADSDILYMSYAGIDGYYHLSKYENGNWSVIGTSSPSEVSGMAVDANGDLIICGSFNSVSGVSVSHMMARYDGSTWHDFSNLADIDVTPQKVLMYEGILYAIGNIWHNGFKVGVMRWVDPTGTPPLESNTLSLYPNPTTYILSVSYSEGELITIRDLSGKTMKSFRTVSDQTVIDVSAFSPGMYLLESGDQRIKQKFVVAY